MSCCSCGTTTCAKPILVNFCIVTITYESKTTNCYRSGLTRQIH